MTFWIFIGYNVYGIKNPRKPLYTYGCNNKTVTSLNQTYFDVTTITSNLMTNINENSKYICSICS